MLFNKNLVEVVYADIEMLKDNKIEESQVLDYKANYAESKDHENNLLKEITSFSNSSGGFLIYGIEETGRGGYPSEIVGIDSNINLERLEQIIISNIRPRISVKFRKIPIPESEQIILIIFIPEGQNQPYYNNRSNKYYKRYNFEAKEMDEHEIEALYQKRFFGIIRFNRYIDEIINFRKSKLPIREIHGIMDGHIIVAPLKFENETSFFSDGRQLRDDIKKNVKFNSYGHTSSFLYGIGSPSKYGIIWSDEYLFTNVEVHRNALVHCSQNYGTTYEKRIKFWHFAFGATLMQTIELANYMYEKYEYYGKVKIVVKISNCLDSELDDIRDIRSLYKCDSEEINVEREWNSWELQEDILKIGKSMMDEILYHFGLWESPYFSITNDIISYGQ